MTWYTIYVFVSIVLYGFSSPVRISASPVKAANSNLEENQPNSEDCISHSVFTNSSYAKPCNNLKLPDPSANVTVNILDPKQAEQLLCFGYYDRILRLCYLDSLTPEGVESRLPKDVVTFDSEVDKNLPNKNLSKREKGMADMSFCSNWNNNLPPMNTSMKSYIVQLDAVMEVLVNCIKICTDSKGEFRPLCMVLAIMDDIYKPAEEPRVESTQREQAQASIVANPLSVGKKSGQEQSQQPPLVSKLTTTLNAPTKSGTVVSADARVEEHKLPEPAVNVKPQEQIDQPIAQQELAKKPSDQPTATEKEGPINKPETGEKEPQKDKNLDKEQDSKKEKERVQPKITEQDPVLPKADAVVPEVSGALSPGAGSSEVEGDKPPMDDKISQQTRDQEDQDLDNPEDIGDFEPPTLHGDADDLSETHAELPEKSNYVPRLPSMRNEDDSHFFGYFTVVGLVCIAGYVGYHNKQKILAMVLEGRRSRGGRGRRRPSTANYRKLDCTLEEAVTSQCNSNVTHVIY